jgi:hypothetical protein
MRPNITGRTGTAPIWNKTDDLPQKDMEIFRFVPRSIWVGEADRMQGIFLKASGDRRAYDGKRH